MENSIITPSQEKASPIQLVLLVPKNIEFDNQEQYVTSSAKVMIKFSPKKDNDSLDARQNDYEKKCDDNSGESQPDDSFTSDKTLDLPNKEDTIEKNQLLFYGVVRDDNNKILVGAAVKVFACYKGGIEKPMAYTYTDNEGAYFINIPEPLDYNELDGFKVRAGK